ncbi:MULTISPECIES: RNA methyltransferase [Alcaligenaceae]|uniref:RNA methyltransferase n=1 Tax=Paracandidimonas lactea TaxID=2895524 RepID=UPI001EF15B49
MVQPSHPGNVGAAARAIKTMGFHDLCLVAPRFADVLSQPEAQSLASGATDVLAAVQIFPDLRHALEGVTLAFAMTARARVIGPPACDIRVAAEASREHLALPLNRVAVVLGTERSGLTNEDIAMCQRICHIPANPAYSSLNVSQALQLAAWELRYALAITAGLPLMPTTEGRPDAGSQLAPNEKVQALLTHWEQAITEVGFLDPLHPKKLMPRMRHMFSRNALTQDEVDMMRGLCSAMIKTAQKVRDK